MLQIVSLPIAAAALGVEGFALYAMMIAVLSWLMLSNLGIGPALTIRVARLRGEEDWAAIRETFSTGYWLMVAIVTSVAFLASLGAISTPMADWLFAGYPGHSREIGISLGLVIIFFCLTTSLNVVEAVQLAFQQQHRLNLFLSGGTLVAAITVIVTASFYASPSAILIAGQMPQLLARLINATSFLRAHRSIAPWPPKMERRLAKPLLADGLRLTSAGALNHFLCHVVPLLAIGALSTATQTAKFAAVNNAIVLAASVFSIVSAPLFGGVPEALSRGDAEWIRRAYLRVLAINLIYAFTVLTLVATVGEQIFQLWYRGIVSPDRWMLVAASVYLVSLGIESVNYTFLATLGQIKAASAWLLTKAVVSASSVVAISGANVSYLPFLILVGSNALLSAIPLTLLMVRQYRAIRI